MEKSTFDRILLGCLVALVSGGACVLLMQAVSQSGREYQLRCVIGQEPSMTSEWGPDMPYLDRGVAWALPGGGFYRMKEGEVCKPVYRKAGG